ncbi:MAG: sialate O-acetylesterase [Pseudomonadota bacterium]
MANYGILAIGQSNMVGLNDGVPITVDSRIKQVSRGIDRGGYAFGSDGDIIDAQRQLQHNSYNTANGSTPAGPEIDYVLGIRNAVDTYCIIPAARGGTGFSNNFWAPGDSQYQDAVSRVAVAEAAGYPLHSILWIQGEQDASNLSYSRQLGKMIDDLRAEIGNLPFIVGSIIEIGADEAATNLIIRETLRHRDKTAFVDATDLTVHLGNHYTAANIAIIGQRMASAYASANIYSLHRHPNQTHGFYADAGISVDGDFEWHSQTGSLVLSQSTPGDQPTNSRSSGVTFAEGDFLEMPADVAVTNGYTRIFRFTSTDLAKVNYVYQTVGGSSLRIGGNKLRFGSAANANAAVGVTNLSSDAEYTVALTHASNGDMRIYFLDGETVTQETLSTSGNSPVAQGGVCRLSYDTNSSLFGLVGNMKAALFYDAVLSELELATESQRLDGQNLPTSGSFAAQTATAMSSEIAAPITTDSLDRLGFLPQRM